MGAVGTQAHLIFPRRVLPGRSWTPPQDDGVGELASLLQNWRRASGNGTLASVLQTRNGQSSNQELANSTVQQDRRCGAQASTIAVASLIQHFEGRGMHPELLQSAEQGHKEQPSEVEKPHTPPKRETPLVPLQRESGMEEEEAAECSHVPPADTTPPGMESINSRLMASILNVKAGLDMHGQPTIWKAQGRDAELPGKLPAYWPAACLPSSTDDPPADCDLRPVAAPSLSHSGSGSDGGNPQAEGNESGGAAAAAGKQHLKTYAELLSEETAAMKNAVGPWQPRVEKSSKLMEFQDTTKRLRRVYKRLQPLREEEGQPDQAEPGQAAVSMVADATAAGHADLASDPEALQLCFNGGQVVGKTPEWVMDVQQPPVSLGLSTKARPSQEDAVSAGTGHAEEDCDVAEASVRRLVARAAIAALAEASQRTAAPGVAASAPPQLPGQQAAAADRAPPMLQTAGYLAWAGLEDSLDLSARVCGAALQQFPFVGARLAAREPDLAGQGQGRSLPVRLLRRSLKLAYGTAGNMVGLGQGIALLAKQL